MRLTDTCAPTRHTGEWGRRVRSDGSAAVHAPAVQALQGEEPAACAAAQLPQASPAGPPRPRAPPPAVAAGCSPTRSAQPLRPHGHTRTMPPHTHCPNLAHSPCSRHQRSSSHSSSTAARHGLACPDVRSSTPRDWTTPTHLPFRLRTLNQPHAGLRCTGPWPGIRNAPAHPPTHAPTQVHTPPPPHAHPRHPPAHTRTSEPPRARRLTVAARLGRVPLVPRLVHHVRGRQRRDGGHGARGRPFHALAARRAARVDHR
jgi:hypothetical protein